MTSTIREAFNTRGSLHKGEDNFGIARDRCTSRRLQAGLTWEPPWGHWIEHYCPPPPFLRFSRRKSHHHVLSNLISNDFRLTKVVLINLLRKYGFDKFLKKKWSKVGPPGAMGPWGPGAWAPQARGARGHGPPGPVEPWGHGPSGPVGPKLGLKWFEKFHVKLKHGQMSQKLFLKWSKVAILFEKMPFDHQ